MGKSWQWFILAYATALGMLLVAKGIQNWIPLVFQIPQLKEGLVKHSQALFLANRTPAVPLFLFLHQNILTGHTCLLYIEARPHQPGRIPPRRCILQHLVVFKTLWKPFWRRFQIGQSYRVTSTPWQVVVFL